MSDAYEDVLTLGDYAYLIRAPEIAIQQRFITSQNNLRLGTRTYDLEYFIALRTDNVPSLKFTETTWARRNIA